MKSPYFILPFLVACGTQEQVSQADPAAKQMQAKSPTEVVDTKKINTQATPRFLRQANSAHVFAINGTKLRSDAAELRPGTQVFDVSVGAFATIRNFLVVVATETGSHWQQDFEVSELARDTFRLTPKTEVLSMDAWYKRLKGETGVVRVELGLDYSPKSDAADR